MSDYHWTGEQKRLFVQTIAETGNVTTACAAVGKSRQSAYALSRRAEGVAFRFGWAAARLIARDVVADILMDRALEGSTVETIKDPETGKTTRIAHDKGLGLALLSRLDQQLKFQGIQDHQMAVMISSYFEEYLRLLEAGATATDIEHFLKSTPFSSGHIHCQLGQKTAKFDRWGDEIGADDEYPMEYKSMDGAPKPNVPFKSPRTAGTFRKFEGVGSLISTNMVPPLRAQHEPAHI